jgi:hypothetical protein
MAAPRRIQALNAQAITATGNSGSLPNIGTSGNPLIVMLIHVSAVSGTTPSITFSLNSVLPDGSTVVIAPLVAITAMTAIGTQRVVFQNTLDPNLQVNWTVSGTTPSLTCSVDLFLSSPDQ